MKTSLIVGMGIGNLYATVLDNLGHGIITVDSDPNKKANFLTVDAAIEECRMFDTVHICTPNFTHEEIARKLAPVSKIVFIEKPGVVTSDAWDKMCKDYPKTRFMMVKNNMWRNNIADLQKMASQAEAIDLLWLNEDRVPNPGTWFTTKELAFGGVSRDLIPHLLSLYIALNPSWRTDRKIGAGCTTNWKLEDLTQTDYGIVKADGIYNVDDMCMFTFTGKWNLSADWKTGNVDCRQIFFHMPDDTIENFQLGLCPEDAYQAMIKDAVDNVDNDDFWQQQFEQDIWIHQQIENL
jgi:predicted dehydrogenase